MIKSFAELGLNPNLVEGLKKVNIIEPTDIQSRTIPLALENKDIIGESQTGSGKTLAYLLPIFERINTTKREAQALILAPTHELAMQIDREIQLLSENSGMQVTSTPIIGDINVERQIVKLRGKPHIITGSTGRILELIKRRKINAQTIKTIVIDEGDKLLDINNLSAVKDVIKTTLKDRQLMVFSATINVKTLTIAKSIMKEPEVIQIQAVKDINPNINHILFMAEQRDKIEVLRKLLASINPQRAIVFINKSDEIRLTASKLQFHKVNACPIYGDASKEERQRAMEGFRTGKTNVLIASDLAARGLDINDVSHIFNLDLPEDSNEYLHRSGRTGRMGKPGTVVSIVSPREMPIIKKYEKDFKIHIDIKEVYQGKILDAELIINPGNIRR
ncbi:MAG: ATP-dependent helicase [Clostridiales bacterium]|nr:ATP-dependent helicase [Clostridiales bacterium]